jgi:hypothetical protein
MTEKKFIQIAERLGWSVTKDRYDIELQFYTDYGQDFSFSVNRNEDYVKQVYDYYNSFDPDEEALLWVDDSGHGKNGAPYRLNDIITDMEEVEKELEKLYDALISAK